MNKLSFIERVLAYYFLSIRYLFDFSHYRMVRKLIFLTNSVWSICVKFTHHIKIENKLFQRLFFICANQYVHTNTFPKLRDINRVLSLAKADDIISTITEETARKRMIVLRSVTGQDNEDKGVLLIKSTEAISWVLRSFNVSHLLNNYHLVLEPSWSGYCSLPILKWMKYNKHKIIIHASEKKDFLFLLSLKSNLVPIEQGAGNYVDYRVFKPLHDIQKKYDFVYVALFKRYKRHHILFKHLKKIKDKNLTVALIGGAWQGSKTEVERIAKLYGVFDNLTFFVDVSHETVNMILNQSKINILLSLREGANKSLFEGFFADIPGILLKENLGVNKNYFTEQTGVVINEADLSAEMLETLRNRSNYTPRKWALKNIAPEISADSIQNLISKIHGLDETVSRKIAVKINSPELAYFHEQDKEQMSHWSYKNFLAKRRFKL